MHRHRPLGWSLALSLVLVLIVAVAPVQAISFGRLDGNGHPNVGSLVAGWREGGGLDHWCTGTLIAPRVFLTASHCTALLKDMGIDEDEVWVTFEPDSGPDATGLIPGTYVTNPEFALSGLNHADPHDIAVVLLAWDAPAVPAVLPARHELDTLPLRSMRFEAVGYGTVREDETRSWQSHFWDPQRRVAEQGVMSLTKSWLNLSMNPSTGNGGTCGGDSGGPHFIAGTNRLVSTTVAGDAYCRATDATYRLDTDSARRFLGEFVDLP